MFADNNSLPNENDRKFPDWVENTVVKGEIAHYVQFFVSHKVFKRHVLQTCKNLGLLEKGLNLLLLFSLSHTTSCFASLNS